MNTVMVHNLIYGGAHRRLSEQLDHLQQSVVEVTLEGADPVTDDAIIVPLTYRGEEAGVLTRPVTRHLDLLSLLDGWRRLHTVVRDLDPDVVWVNNCRYMSAPRLPEDLARRSVYYCDEARRANYEDAVRRTTRMRTRLPYWPMRQVLRHMDRVAVRSVAAITTNSFYSLGRIHQAYGRDAIVIPCGAADRFRPPTFPVSRDHLLSVGSLIPSKGHDLAIEAAGRSGLGLPMVVVAPRQNRQEEERLRTIALRSGVELSVKVGVTDDELVALYQSAVVTLYMAQLEPFGLVSIEAQSCGCPVIVSDEGGLTETLEPGVTGWAVARQVSRIAERLSQFKDPALSEELGSAAAAGAGKWSWSVSAERLQAVFTSVASR